MPSVLSLSLRDFFTKKFLKFALLPLFFGALLLALLSYFGFYWLIDYFSAMFGANEGSSFLAWLYSLAIFKILIAISGFLFSSFVVVFASVFIAFLIVAFLTPFIAKEINAKYYHHELTSPVSLWSVLLKMGAICLKFLFFFVCASLLLLIPFINLFIYYFVFYYLFHKLLMLDVASSVLNTDEYKAFYAKSSPFEFKFATLCFYLCSSTPLLGLFLQVFYVIFLSHLFYQRVLDLKPVNLEQKTN